MATTNCYNLNTHFEIAILKYYNPKIYFKIVISKYFNLNAILKMIIFISNSSFQLIQLKVPNSK